MHWGSRIKSQRDPVENTRDTQKMRLENPPAPRVVPAPSGPLCHPAEDAETLWMNTPKLQSLNLAKFKLKSLACSFPCLPQNFGRGDPSLMVPNDPAAPKRRAAAPAGMHLLPRRRLYIPQHDQDIHHPGLFFHAIFFRPSCSLNLFMKQQLLPWAEVSSEGPFQLFRLKSSISRKGHQPKRCKIQFSNTAGGKTL